MNKKELRHKHNIPQDAFIINTTMRNQKRKLFPDLIEMFSDYLKYCIDRKDYKKANNTYLYLHTSYPDVGFDIPRHIMQNGVGHKVILTYYCPVCKNYHISHFMGEIITCPHCGNNKAHMPNTGSGVDREQLCEIYNIADLYVQYSICEGLGMPIAEAKACGIPAMGIEYSATAEQVSKDVGCQPLKIGKTFHESVLETEQIRCLPDPKDAVSKIYKFFSKTPEERQKMGQVAMEDAINNYSYDRCAQVFTDAIDSLDYDMSQETTWLNPEPNLLEFPEQIPNFRYASELIDWCFENVLKRNDLKYSYFKNQLVKGLNTGVLRTDRDKGVPFGYNECLKKFNEMVNKHNYYEHLRMDIILGKTSQKQIWSTI